MMMSARVNPTPPPNENTTAWTKLYSRMVWNRATARIAQLVVISGRKMPSARNRAGLNFLMNISTSCTAEAITAM